MGKFGKRSIRRDGLPRYESAAETLDLHKLRVDEAEAKIDRFVNDCVMRGVTRVKIIHGNGTGALRRTTERWLKANGELVQTFRSFGPGFEAELTDIGHHARRSD